MNSRNLIVLLAGLIIIAGGFTYYFFVIGRPNPLLEANPQEIISEEASTPIKEETSQTKPVEENFETVSKTEEETIFNIPESEAKNLRQKNLGLAQEKAKEWQQDAILYRVIFQISPSYKLNEGTETYVFGSNAVPDQWWTFTVSQISSKFVRALIPKNDYLGEITTPAAINFWQTSYIEALKNAEKNGGEDFRSKNLNGKIEITLMSAEPRNWLWWIVKYKNDNGEELQIQIDPNKGEVLNEKLETSVSEEDEAEKINIDMKQE